MCLQKVEVEIWNNDDDSIPKWKLENKLGALGAPFPDKMLQQASALNKVSALKLNIFCPR